VEPIIRAAAASDAEFLARMLVEAVAWRPDAPRPAVADVLAAPEFGHYVVGWPRTDDRGVVAELALPDGATERAGAAWYRFLTAADAGYGFVDEATPEITIGVVDRWRRRGVGRALLTGLIDTARADGLAARIDLPQLCAPCSRARPYLTPRII
jgi:GNAT superfamily N-acetyltransferase